ncbi:hypothetical protein L3Y34_019637 [Caenorhabditis briggsae]|uniref:C2H2-type domain-containing protein n=1 Tax=Caenorhabditis briggsae TaxID=6238 RepID=A0AAE9IWZ5_CAEBR|nr:hypothetical protein L3Y34_019637 [Caenorhabditis briggsae]
MKVKKIEKKQKTPEPPAPPVKKQHVPFYKCSYCNYKTDDQKRLKRHTIAHQKPGQIMPECDVCHARFSHKFGLKRHQMSNCKFESFGCSSSSSEAPASPMEIPEISASPEPPMDFEIEDEQSRSLAMPRLPNFLHR